MKIVKYQWLDERLVGGAKIECDCGFVFEKDTLDGDWDADTIVECPKCHKKEKFHVKIQFIFENP